MNGQFDLITLISLVVAAVAIFKLRSVLGQRTGDDDARVERQQQREAERRAQQPEQASADVITLPRREGREPVPEVQEAGNDNEVRIRAYPAIDAGVTDGLLAIAKLDKSFEPESFLQGANRAYELIVSAFAEGNRKGLKDLLSREVYDGFVAAIGEREARGEKIEQQFVGIKKSDIVEAEVKNGTAFATVRFISQLITAHRNRSGDLISGDPQAIVDVTDIWTFSRDVSSGRALSNPNWRLVATQAPN